MAGPRHLAPFDIRHVPHYFTDVVIIGAGLAGLRAAIAVDPQLSALILTKGSIDESNSQNAQGGIAGVLDPEDCFDDHIADTLAAGGALCDERVVEMVVQEAPKRIRELIDWGTRFDRRAGALVLGREGGHGRRRVAHALPAATHFPFPCILSRMKSTSKSRGLSCMRWGWKSTHSRTNSRTIWRRGERVRE